jgi:predicted P-loop ATPase
MVKGNKNDSILYFRAKQGFGKSTFNEFIWHHVIGNELGLETGSRPLRTDFNAILGGKLFVYFEELETFSTAQWMCVSSRLKRYATSQTITLAKQPHKAQCGWRKKPFYFKTQVD